MTRRLAPSFSLLTLVFILLTLPNCHERLSFDQEAWKDWVEGEENAFVRYRMAKDIIKKDLLFNLNKAQVMDMLGDPGNKDADLWSYNTGPCEDQFLIGIDYSVLDVYFERMVVKDVKLECHDHYYFKEAI